MKLNTKLKGLLVVALTVSAIAPTAAFAIPAHEEELDRIYGPENGTAVTVDHPQAKYSLRLPREAKTFVWSANYQVTTHYQIPNDIVLGRGYNAIWFRSNSSKNTGSNSNYQVMLESWSTWAAGWVEDNKETSSINSISGAWFKNLSSTEKYRIRIKGNVKGSIDVYKNSF
ncbi:hypothetical protein [Paenibacillus popilliae]|uniref:Amino acid transporter n=1 Tax=Paenibacillus popilliae ATCC 14706 TaxID=1212764 RepID=M9LNV0_PAEPP|nr:hypothetical protein [Paenibacillus popilliae]GAC42091.1 amino acid transporter [Paenibacillus popilliae ATCC 14706]